MSVEIIRTWLRAGSSQPLLVGTQSLRPLGDFFSDQDLKDTEVLSLAPEGKITIKQVRELLAAVSLVTTYTRRLIFIPDAERLQTAAANTLLKTLEEASDKNRFLLTSAYPGRLLATIRSRCRTIRLPHRPSDGKDMPPIPAPIFTAKRKTPVTADEAEAIAALLHAKLRAGGSSTPIHRGLARLRDFHKARTQGVGEKLASDALLASLVDIER